MSTAATMSQPPVIPPRPSRSADKSPASSDAQPKVPPRPLKRFDRSVSPACDRFAPSPLNDSPFQPKSPRASRLGVTDDPIQRPGSVNMPSVGEEGNEYEAVQDKFVAQPAAQKSDKDLQSSSAEQTRTVAHDLHLHAPKPSVPAQTSKERVMAVTRTDSDKAASYGIGRPSSGELPERGDIIKKKRSSVSHTSETESVFDDDEHGIPEIGQRVPMNPYLGDVQAPSPALRPSSAEGGARSQTPRHHHRKHSSRGFADLPPGSYGLHGHGTPQPNDKLEKAWYDKHPGDWKRESAVSLHDRQNDFAMSSDDLNKLVRSARESGMGTSAGYIGTPSEEVGYHASEEYTQRLSSRPGSTAPRSPELQRVESHPRHSPVPTAGSPAVHDDEEEAGVIHVDASHNRSRSFLANPSEENVGETEENYHAPILASDEVAKNPTGWGMQPAVEPKERRDSFRDEDASSRPTSRPTSLYNNNSTSNLDLNSTQLEDVEEYEPLFPEEEEKRRQQEEAEKTGWKPRHKFPSKDIWEDAPDSVNATAVVSTPELPEDKYGEDDVESYRPETPAHAFARLQEQLAEKESHESENFIRKSKKPVQAPVEQIKAQKGVQSPNRFPSRDIWEDTPESLMHQTTVGSPEPTEESRAAAPARPQVPARPQKKFSGDKPALPERPKPRTSSGDDQARPAVSDKPKPQVPARPTKTLPSGTDSKEQDAAPRQKPAVPARPAGSKIQALQAGFMSDLNKRLQLGPQAHKKEEQQPAADMVEEKKETKPLADARKGRARGPQRRAPAARSPAPVSTPGAPVLSFSPLRTCWSIGDSGVLEIDEDKPEPKVQTKEAPVEARTQPEAPVAEPAEEQASPATKAVETVSAPSEEAETQPSTETQPLQEVDSTASAADEEAKEEVKTLASNMAGEPVVEATLEEKADDVEPVAVETTGGDKA